MQTLGLCVQGRVGLVGDAAGYVTKCSGEGIYFAAKSGRMCAEAIVAQSKNGTVMVRPCYTRRNLSCATNTFASISAHIAASLAWRLSASY